MGRKLIVTHHAPDLDAITSSWLLKNFDAQHYADAQFEFVNPGDRISEIKLQQRKISPTDVTHVDTGLGKFDHHQMTRGHDHSSASSLVHDYLCQIHPELKNDHALQLLIKFVTDIDHFEEIHWPEADHYRYNFMLHEIIRGLEFIELHDDDSQLHFGFICLNGVYSALKQQLKAEQILKTKAQYFQIQAGKCMAVKTRNDEVLKLAQKHGAVIALRKDTLKGHIRIKARPDTDIDLKPLYEKILRLDPQATWFYHPSGKMLINGSRKHRQQKPSELSLAQMIELIKNTYETA